MKVIRMNEKIEYKTREQKRKFYDSGAWRKLRSKIKKRDNYECQWCKASGRLAIDRNEQSKTANRKKISLVCHHIKEIEFHPELAHDEDNIVTICVPCHEKHHGRSFMYKQKKEKEEWSDERWIGMDESGLEDD